MIVPRTVQLVTLFVLGAASLFAHEEPAKTIKERMEHERHRRKTVARKIRVETLWKVTGSTRSRQLITLFDRNGNPVEETAFGPDSLPTARVLSNYTPEHILFQKTVIAVGDTERTAFTFLPSRLVAAATDFSPSGYARSLLEYLYTDTLIVATKSDSMGAPVYRILYRYPQGTAYGVMTEARQEDASGQQVLRMRNVYQGELRTAKLVYDGRDSLDYTFLYVYTEDGDLDTITKQLANGTTVYQRRYHYAPDGGLQSIAERDAGGVLRLLLEYEYERYGEGE